MIYLLKKSYFFLFILPVLLSCRNKSSSVSAQDIIAMNLKKGEVVSCGPPEKNFGSITFDVSCSAKVKKDFNLGVALLHSFEYDEGEKVFVKIINEEPDCAMAYWVWRCVIFIRFGLLLPYPNLKKEQRQSGWPGPSMEQPTEKVFISRQ